ncbi:hypothetical protein HNR46_003979 [Haloferula luteola]|uniref:Uncharacterized protein n=1 Tax=Haloferula luteola TaxID=595692 RepID=A0A840VGJ7_9BACT|nr:hypothetical protein [Haloferula luteola]
MAASEHNSVRDQAPGAGSAPELREVWRDDLQGAAGGQAQPAHVDVRDLRRAGVHRVGVEERGQ